jgi:hypothetical protein
MNSVSTAGATSNLQAVPSSGRQLITAESANQSTNLGAVNLPAVRVQPTDRPYFIGGSNARVIIGTDDSPLLWLWREKRGDKPEDLLKYRCYGANALFYATAVFFLRWLPKKILLILLLFLNRNKRLRFGAFDEVSSNQLVR